MSIRHPNIVQVKEAVVDAGSMYMVMELVDFDLGLLIEHMQQPFSEGQVKCLAMQLLSALSAVHENFILHRDLKQTNLLLDRNGVLKLCDFGLARRCSTPTPNPTPDPNPDPDPTPNEVEPGEKERDSQGRGLSLTLTLTLTLALTLALALT